MINMISTEKSTPHDEKTTTIMSWVRGFRISHSWGPVPNFKAEKGHAKNCMSRKRPKNQRQTISRPFLGSIFFRDSVFDTLKAWFCSFWGQNGHAKNRRSRKRPKNQRQTISRPFLGSIFFRDSVFHTLKAWFRQFWAQTCKTNFLTVRKTTEKSTPEDFETIFGQHFSRRFRFSYSQGLAPASLEPKLQNQIFKDFL